MSEAAQRNLLLELDTIFANASLGILYSRDRVLQRCNPRAAEILGYAPDELIGQPGIRIYPNPAAYEAIGRAAGPKLAAGESFNTEMQLLRKDGSPVWCQVFAKAFDPRNTQAGTIWIFDDIEQARRARKEVEAILNNASIGIVFTRDRTIQRYNPKFAEMLKLGDYSLIGKPAREFFESDESYSTLSAAAFPLLSVGKPFHSEMVMRAHDDSRFPAEVIAYLVDPADPPQGTIWIVNDISGRNARQEQLKAMAGQLQALMANAPVGILFTRDRQIRECNTEFSEMFGFSRDGAIGQPACLLFRSESEYAELGRLAEPPLSRGEPFQKELYMRRQDGSDLWVNLIGFVSNPENTIQGTFWLLEDRTPFKRAEEALRESHARLEQRVAERTRAIEMATLRLQDFAETASDWFWEMGPDLRFTYFSDRMSEVLGIAPGVNLGKTRQEVMNPDDIDAKWQQHFADLEQHRPFRNFEYRIKIPRGKTLEISVSGKPIFDETGAFLGYRGIGQDISERKRVEREMEQKSAILQATLDNMAQGISVADGDLRLVAMNDKFCELLGFPLELAKPGTHFSEFIRYNAEHGEYGTCDVKEKVRELTALAKDFRPHRFRRRRPNGRIIEVAGNRMPGGGFVTTYTDVTDEELAQQALRLSEQRYRALTELSPAAILIMRERCIAFANETAVKLFGVTDAEQLVGRSVLDFVAPEFVQRVVDRNIEIEISQETNHRLPWLELDILRADGSRVTVESSGVSANLDEGKSVLSVIRDITERKKAEEALRNSEERFLSLFEKSPVALSVTTEQDGFTATRWNQTWLTHFGYPAALAQGKSGNEIGLWVDPERRKYYINLADTQGDVGGIEAQMYRYDGSIRWVSVSGRFVEAGGHRMLISLYEDITERKQHQQQLEHIAHHDALTGLPNRVLLADRLKQATSQAIRRHSQVAVVYLDLDGFKEVNDNHGHGIGDQLLVNLAVRMKQALREGDTLARLGGDEFVAVLLDLEDREASEPILQRLLKSAAEPIIIGDLRLGVSASIGVSFFPQADNVDADQLLRQADQAMYQAKQSGKNRYHLFDTEQDRAVRGRHESIERIREALENLEFILHYQPKVNLRTGEIVGAEALIRWQHPEQGLLSPGMFLPLIENDELITLIGDWTIEAALQQMESWLAAGLELPVSVNLAGRQLQSPGFLGKLRAALHLHPSVAHLLELEVLESSALDDISQVSEVIEACRAMGVGFALDDFGTGYSSLTYLKRLPAQTLKIDQSFVRDMLDDPEDLAILDGIIGLAESFQRRAIAEGMETPAHGEMLLRLGCELVQGYAIARPMPGDAIVGWAASWTPDRLCRVRPRIDRADMPVLFVMTEHRAWIKALDFYLKEKQSVPPPLDHHHCRFGQWLDKGGMQRYASRPVFEQILVLHETVHRRAEEILTIKHHGEEDEIQVQFAEIEQMRDQLLELLEQLIDGNAN